MGLLRNVQPSERTCRNPPTQPLPQPLLQLQPPEVGRHHQQIVAAGPFRQELLQLRQQLLSLQSGSGSCVHALIARMEAVQLRTTPQLQVAASRSCSRVIAPDSSFAHQLGS